MGGVVEDRCRISYAIQYSTLGLVAFLATPPSIKRKAPVIDAFTDLIMASAVRASLVTGAIVRRGRGETNG